MYEYLATCPGCGFSLPPIYYLCKRCWSQLSLQKKQHFYEEYRWPVYTIWSWEKKDALVHRLLRRRKRASIRIAEYRLACWAVSVLPQKVIKNTDAIFFPTKKQNASDHTGHLANAVADIMGLRAFGIMIAENKNYKIFSRSQRNRERVKNTVTYTEYKGQNPLMVDDIITSGATLESVWRALGRPGNATGLCLAYKTFNPGDKI